MTSLAQTNYQPTLMQKLLGRNYKWWYLFSNTVKAQMTNYANSVAFVLGHILIVTSTILIWWLANDKIVDSGFSNKLSYFIFGELFFATIFQFASFYAYDIIRGNHSNILITPSSFMKIIFFRYLGAAFLQNITKLLFLAIAAILLHQFLYFSSLNLLLLLVPCFLIGLLTLFFLEFIVACSGFLFNRVDGIILNYGFLSSILAGRSFPLNLLIPGFYFNLFNPFSFTFYHPMQIYLGKYSSLETFYVFLGGIAWCIVLYFLAKWVFKMGLKKNEAVGL